MTMTADDGASATDARRRSGDGAFVADLGWCRGSDADGLRINHLPSPRPALLVAHMRMGLRFAAGWAVIFCKPPKRTFEDVSLP